MNTQKVPYENVKTGKIPFEPKKQSEVQQQEQPIGMDFGKFYIRKNEVRLNAGGQANVYPCYQKSNPNEPVVAKVYVDSDNLERIEKINRIIQTIPCASLPHIYCVKRYADNCLAVVMDSYREIPNKLYQFEVHGYEKKYRRRLLNLIGDMTDALEHLIDKNIYHADIKPANIMQKRGGNVAKNVLIDFGGSLFFASEENVQNEEINHMSVKNSLFSNGYQAPEFFDGQYNKTNEYTDVYSLGISIAELVAGVYPKISDLKRVEATNAQRDYLNRNQGGQNLIHGVLLPKDMPEDLLQFFRGTLYKFSDDPQMQKNRWSLKEIREWLRYELAGKYEEAKNIPVGESVNGVAQVSQPQQKTSSYGLERPIYIAYEQEKVKIHTVEDMVSAFLSHWNETVAKMTADRNFPKMFDRLGGDVVATLRNAANDMRNSPSYAPDIMEHQVIEYFMPEDQKMGFRIRGMSFRDKKEFGQKLYAALVAAEQSGMLHHIPSGYAAMQAGSDDDFSTILILFERKELSKMSNEGNPDFTFTEQEMKYLRKWEGRMHSYDPNDKKNKARDIVDLYLLAFSLQGRATYCNHGKIYTSLQDLMKKDIEREWVSGNREKVIEWRKQMYDQHGKMLPAFYAWLQKVPDIANSKRPKEEQLSHEV